jgi:hypothetical protein
MAVLVTIVVLAVAGPASAQVGETIPAPATTTSADGRTTTDGTRTLSVSKVAGLAAEGETVRVTGTGYDTNKGIYVAFCVLPAKDQPPTPCGGGMDTSGSGGGSHWISSNGPSYGKGLFEPYGPGGSFDVTIDVKAALNDDTDCRAVRCALVTRNDHLRSSDRSQDIFVPVSFAAPAPTTTAAPRATPTTAAPPTTAAATAPETTTTTSAPTTTTTSTTLAEASTTTTAAATTADEDLATEAASTVVEDDDDDGSAAPAAAAVVLVLVLAAGTGGLLLRRRRSGGAA